MSESVCRCRLALGGTMVLLALVAGASAQAPQPGKNFRTPAALPITAFYKAPQPLPPGKPGELIRSEATNQYSLPFELSAIRVLYHSRTANGADVAVSGVVLVPDGKPPAGGWPVIAWAHDFRGLAPQCAPSLQKNLGVGPLLAMYANLGYVVVATDYAGLGANSGSAVLDMRSNALDVIYAVEAARSTVKEAGTKWVAIGPFQGALAVSGVAEGDARAGDFLGSMATSGLADAEDATRRFALRSSSRVLAVVSTIKAMHPEFPIGDVLNDEGVAAYRRALASCGGESEPGFRSDTLKPGWEGNPFMKEFFAHNTPGQAAAHGPLMVVSGESDPAVPADITAKTVARMCKQGDRVLYLKYANLDSSGVVGASAADQVSWIKARFAGRAAPSNCP